MIRRRVAVYREETAPLIDHYAERELLRNFRSGDPTASPDHVVKEIISLIQDAKKG